MANRTDGTISTTFCEGNSSTRPRMGLYLFVSWTFSLTLLGLKNNDKNNNTTATNSVDEARGLCLSQIALRHHLPEDHNERYASTGRTPPHQLGKECLGQGTVTHRQVHRWTLTVRQHKAPVDRTAPNGRRSR